MSTTIDQKVVEMRFDNKHFEQNVSNTMSTLEKLKQKLKFNGVGKGLEDIGAAASKIDMTGLGNGIQTVQAKFSAMQIAGITALSNITNSAVNAGKRIVSAFTIDPIKTGFEEYETQINAVQTILANTQSKGTTLSDVNGALDKLNAYADKTIYNFTEMTRNIGTFTAAGVDLDTSVNAIQGIANLAAISGSTSQQASTAMYQLSQALSSGTVKLMDWNSVVNAGMGGQVFQDALKETARVHGVTIDKMIKEKGSFRETLQAEWLTSEILTETLQKFTLTTEGLTEEQIEANKAMLKAKGYTEAQIEEIFKLGNTATDAATKVKTFSQLFDTLKEAAQSGWTQTWEIIFGDFEQAKKLFTGLSDSIGSIIGAVSDWRNSIVGGAFSSGFAWDKFSEKIKNAGISSERFESVFKEVAKAHGISIDELITKHGSLEAALSSGEIKNAADLIKESLKKISESTEESVDSLKKEDTYLVKKGDNLTKIGRKYGMTWRELYKLNKDIINDPNLIYPDQVLKLTDAQLENIGYTREQVEAFRELSEQADITGSDMDLLIAQMSGSDGRALLIEAFKDIGHNIMTIAKSIGKAWTEIFPSEEMSFGIYKAIVAFKNFTSQLRFNEEVGDKLVRTFKGVFAIVDIITTIIGGGFKIAFKLVSQVLKYFDTDILEVTASIGDSVVGLRDWFDNIFDVSHILDIIVPILKLVVKGVISLVKAVKESEAFKNLVAYISDAAVKLGEFLLNIGNLESFTNFVSGITKAGNLLIEWFKGLKDAEDIPEYIISGFVNGIKEYGPKALNVMFELAKDILKGICEALGIHSPSTEFKEVGNNIMQGLIQGITELGSILYETIKTIGYTLIDIIKQLDIGTIIAAVTAGGATYSLIKFSKAMENFAKPFESIAGVFDGLKDTLKEVEGYFGDLRAQVKAQTWKKRADAILELAIAIGILALSIYVLSKIKSADLLESIIAIAALSAIIVLLSVAVDKIGSKKDLEIKKLAAVMLGIAASVLILSFALKNISDIPWDGLLRGVVGLVALGGILVGLIAATKLAGPGIDKMGGTLIKMSLAILLMAFVMKQVSKLDPMTILTGSLAILAFGGVYAALIYITKLSAGADTSKLASTIMKMSFAILLMVGVAILISLISTEALIKGGLAIIAFGGIVTGLIAATRLASGKDLKRLGTTLVAISVAMLLMATIAAILSMVDTKDLIKGIVAVAALGGIATGLIAATKLAGKDLKGIASTLSMIAVAMGVMALIAVLLGLISIDNLARGVTAVGLLSAMIAGLIWSTKGATDCSKNIMMIAIAIGAITISLISLSFIDPKKLASAAGALGAVLGMFALAMKAGGNMKTSIAPLIIMIAAIAMVAGAIYALAKLPIKSSLAAAASLSILLLTMSASMLIISKSGSVSYAAIGGLALMGLVVAELAVILGVLSYLNVEGSISTVASLSILLGVMTGVLVVLGAASALISTAFVGIGAIALMGVVVGMLAGILLLMDNMDVEKSIVNARALCELTMALSLALIPLTLIGATAYAPFVGIAALTTLIAAIGGLIVGIGYLATEYPQLQTFLDTGIPMLEKIGYAIGSFFGNIVAGFSESAMSSLPKIGQYLSDFMLNAMPFIIGIKLVDASTVVGVGFLASCIVALSAANLIEGVHSFLAGGTSFSRLGTELSQFMLNAMPFITGANMINAKTMDSVKTLAETILLLTGAELVQGITSFLTGGASLSDFGKELPALGGYIKEFVNELGTFSKDQVTTVNCAVNAIKSILSVAKDVPSTGGLASLISGESDIGAFCAKLPAIATNIRWFIQNLGDNFGKKQLETIETASKALVSIVSVANDIPNEGGLASLFAGDNDIGAFCAKLPAIGTNIRWFIQNLGDNFGKTQLETVEMATKALTSIVSIASEIPNDGGLAGLITGNNDIGTFCAKLPIIGANILGFINGLGGSFNEGQVNVVKQAMKALSGIVSVAHEIPNDGGLVAEFAGNNNLGAFCRQLPKAGENLRGFVDKLGVFTQEQADAAKFGIETLSALASATVNIPESGGIFSIFTGENNILTFSAKLPGVAKHLKDFVDNLGTFTPREVLTVESAAAAISALASLAGADLKTATAYIDDFGAKLPALGTNLAEFAVNVIEVGVDAVHGLSDGINATSNFLNTVVLVKERFEGLIDGVIKAAEEKTEGIEPALKKIINKVLATLTAYEYYEDFLSAGAYLAEGFAEGIDEATYLAEAKAKAMARAAEKAAKEELDINSPSKVFRKIGTSVPEGFAQGIGKLGGAVQESSRGMAKNAVDAVKKSISNIASMVNSDIDSQPTIRPVIDLSDVKTGASAISGMFGQGISVGATANVRAINSMMNHRSQNGDIISAIDKLRKDVSNLGGTTYNINGITYDDGSSISAAVGTLVRAATLERRT